MGERGPLPRPWARRRNQRHGSGKSVTVGRPSMPRDMPDEAKAEWPSMPRDMPDEAKAEWRRIVPLLEEAELLSTIDRALLVRYCCA